MDEKALVQEVGTAIYRGDKARARTLLTQLITQEPAKAQYWVWLSNVSESREDQVNCLQQALRLDPKNADARARLNQMGVKPIDPPPPTLSRISRTNSEQEPGADRQPIRKRKRGSKFQFSRDLSVLGLWAIIACLVAIAFWIRMGTKEKPVSYALPGTAKPSATLLPTTSPVVRSPTPTFVGPTPLWMFLEATYTPTPVYVNTPHPISEAYRVGMQKYEQGNFPGMISYMEQVLTLEPEAADASFYIAEGYRLQGNRDKAVEYYEKTIEIDPEFAPAYLGRAQANFAEDPRGDVMGDVAQALGLDPNLVEAYLFSASVYLEHGDARTALDDLAKAEALAGTSPALYALRAEANLMDGQAAEALEDALQAHTLDLTMLSGYRILGMAYQANGEMEASIDPLEVYLRYESEDTDAWVYLASGQYAIADYAAAMASLNQALAADNTCGEAYLLRGTVYLDQAVEDGKREAALLSLDDFSWATTYEADAFRLAIGKGRAYLLLGMNDAALADFNRAFGSALTDARRAEAYYWRAQTYAALARLDDALADWQALLNLPEEVCQAEWRGMAEQQLGIP